MDYLNVSAVHPAALLLLVALLLAVGMQLLRRARRQAADEADQRLQQGVADRTRQLSELARHLQLAREDERARLARDLHDELGSLLTAAKLDAARIRSRLAGSAPEALERLTHLVGLLDQVVAVKRRITEDLMPSTLVHLGLVPALESLAQEFGQASGAEVHCTLLPVPLAPAAELTVYRLVQEALTNTGKHAGATHAWISLAAAGDDAEVVVRDDGQGFDAAACRGGAYGLVGMRFRVEAEGGTVRVTTEPGHGTCVRARLPRLAVHAAPAAAAAAPRQREAAEAAGVTSRLTSRVTSRVTSSL